MPLFAPLWGNAFRQISRFSQTILYSSDIRKTRVIRTFQAGREICLPVKIARLRPLYTAQKVTTVEFTIVLDEAWKKLNIDSLVYPDSRFHSISQNRFDGTEPSAVAAVNIAMLINKIVIVVFFCDAVTANPFCHSWRQPRW